MLESPTTERISVAANDAVLKAPGTSVNVVSVFSAGEAWVRIAQALATSPQAADREFGQAVLRYVREMRVVKTLLDRSSARREIPGISRTIVTPTRSGAEIER